MPLIYLSFIYRFNNNNNNNNDNKNYDKYVIFLVAIDVCMLLFFWEYSQ